MQGLLIGISNALTGQSRDVGPGAKIANDYKARVIVGGGVVESLDCVIDIINNLDAI